MYRTILSHGKRRKRSSVIMVIYPCSLVLAECIRMVFSIWSLASIASKDICWILHFSRVSTIFLSFVTYIEPFQATFKLPKAIRGGIPICFPQVCASLNYVLFFQFLYFILFSLLLMYTFLYAVWKSWLSGTTRICKEQDVEHWSWSPAISNKYFQQGLHWFNP